MAQRLDTVTPDIINPDATYLDGAYEDEDVSVIGSPSLAGAANSQYYFFSNMMKKAKTLFNGLVDNSIVEQYLKALTIVTTGSEDAVDWDSGNTYSTAGTLVRDAEGDVYSSTGITSNLNKSPSNPANVAYWFPCKPNEELRRLAKDGTVLGDAMHAVHNRAGAQYAQNLLVGKKTIDGVDYEMHYIHLDNTVVTGNTTLEALLAGYPYIDKYAPDNLGTRTLVDMSSRHIAPQSVGGDNDGLGEVLEDHGQGHYHGLLDIIRARASGVPSSQPEGSNFNIVAGNNVAGLFGSIWSVSNPVTDLVNGTPRTGATTRPKEFTVGSSYIIVMIAV